jgi:GPH family glycoside/pentoside/hexuronide:cation symporter
MHIRDTVYFLKYVLGAAELVRYALPFFAAVSVVSAPLWVWVIRRSSKRSAWQLGCLVTAVSGLALHLPAALQPVCAIALLGVFALGTTAYGVCFWAMLPDTVEYNEWRFGRRDEAKVFGIASFTQKIGMGLSAMAAGVFLDAFGFTANQAQGPAALDAIRATMGLIPACGMAVSMLIMRGYGIDAAAHRHLAALLSARRDGAAAAAAED